MGWPQAQDYQEAVQNPQQVFADPELQRAEVVCNKLGLPAPYSGSAAVVYHLHTPDRKCHWAVKCFTRPVRDLQQRYRDISAHLNRFDLPFTVGLQYLEQGIYLSENWYPVLKMDWVEGQTFHQFLAERLDQTRLLQALCPMWLRLAKRLEEARVVHGDLQHGNVILVPGSNEGRVALKLVDYDGMWVPELAGLPMTEQGHEAYQHPQREQAQMVNAGMDRFSHLVIYGTLRCLALRGRSLWERYHDGNNLLFNKKDFRSPGESLLLRELWSSSDEELRSVAGHILGTLCGPLEAAPPLETLLAGDEVRPLTPAELGRLREVTRILEGDGTGSSPGSELGSILGEVGHLLPNEREGADKSARAPEQQPVFKTSEEKPAGQVLPQGGTGFDQHEEVIWKQVIETALDKEDVWRSHFDLLRRHLQEIQARAMKELQAGSALWLQYWPLMRFLLGGRREKQRQHLLEMLKAASPGLEAAARAPLGLELLRDWLRVASDPFDLPPPVWRLLELMPPEEVEKLPGSGLPLKWRASVLVPMVLGAGQAKAMALLRTGDGDLLSAFADALGHAESPRQEAVIVALSPEKRLSVLLKRLPRSGGTETSAAVRAERSPVEEGESEPDELSARKAETWSKRTSKPSSGSGFMGWLHGLRKGKGGGKRRTRRHGQLVRKCLILGASGVFLLAVLLLGGGLFWALHSPQPPIPTAIQEGKTTEPTKERPGFETTTATSEATELKQAHLALDLGPLTRRGAERLRVAQQGQAEVFYVVSGGGGDCLGLRAGDVVIRVNGRATARSLEAESALRGLQLGAQVEIEVEREGSRQTLAGRYGTPFGEEEELRRVGKAAVADPAAQYYLGQMYATGRGAAKDEATALHWYRKAAEQGHARAQFELGMKYWQRSGEGREEVEAVQWFRKAAEQGYARAQNQLGWMYSNGSGLSKDKVAAVQWYRKAAEQGDAMGLYNLGVMYANGQGVAKDEVEAVQWYRKAAEQGNAMAQNNLGVMYKNGRGVVKDEAEAAQWYRKAAEQGNAMAQNNLGVVYQYGHGVPKDPVEAVRLYRKAAEHGYAAAQFNLGAMYANGEGVLKDEAEAIQWYRKAAAQGNAMAQNNLGVMYENGQGMVKDEAEAVQWYRKAAEQNYALAQANLASMYEKGAGVRKNEQEAIAWYRKAAAQGDARAKSALQRLKLPP